MAGVKGRITKSAKRGQRSVYLSNVLGIFEDRGRLHVTSLIPSQKFHTNITKRDGLLYDLLILLYHHGLAVGAEQPAKPAPAD